MSQKIRVLGLLTLLTIGVYFFPEIITWGDVAKGFAIGFIGTGALMLFLKITKII